jgi:biotin-dependent carboxylase-like uncharacterized protein
MKLFHVLKPGAFTIVQDLGRYGYLRYGVPVSGAMDTFSHVTANLLVANHPNDATLEITLLGPELESLAETEIAITGANLSPKINKTNAPMWRTVRIKKGDIISFGTPQNGCRAYLAVRGGINVPEVLGSRSTYTRGGFGGINGRPLRAGDTIYGFNKTKSLSVKLEMPRELVPEYPKEYVVRAILGPQAESFTKKGIETFFSSVYTITTESDRMGYRLDGPSIEHVDKADIVSDAILPGAVQVPESGKPIIMMRDAQTTGGYTKIAVVTTPDLSLLAQAKPGNTIKFVKTSLAEARSHLIEFHRKLNTIKTKFLKKP